MHNMCDTREICEARKSRSSCACRASSRDLCMRDIWEMPRPADLRACEANDSAGHYTIPLGLGLGVHIRVLCRLADANIASYIH
jgi:hypothetical protein